MQWKVVVGYEDRFEVSNTGLIRSRISGRTLKQTTSVKGYKTISSRIGGRSGKAICLKVHRVVAEAFLAPPSVQLTEACSKEHWGKVIVRHLDNNKTNNSVENLAWGTSQDNANDYWGSDAPKNVVSGSNHPLSKLSSEAVDEIRRTYTPRHKTFGCRALAVKFGVSHPQISDIINGRAYK